MKWISVKERLPEEEERYAILYRYKGANTVRKFIGDYDPIEKRWKIMLDSVVVTHWMELPKPPNS